MFKKSLAAVAVLGAFAGSALAADVQLYGLVDLGLNWTQVDNGKTTTDSFGMGSGQNSGSRFGLKGTEDLGTATRLASTLKTASRRTTALSTRAPAFSTANPSCSFRRRTANSPPAARAVLIPVSAATVRWAPAPPP